MNLEDEESLMGQIDSTIFEEGSDLGVRRVPVVDGVLRFVVLVRRSSHGKTRIRDCSEGVRSGLRKTRSHS